MSAPKRYRKKPVEIQAMQFTGDNAEHVAAWCGGEIQSATCHGDGPPYLVAISTLEGRMVAGRSDYVIRGVQGEFYPCKESIFHETYEVVTSMIDREFVHTAAVFGADWPETHRQGALEVTLDVLATVDRSDLDFGVQIANDGRVWVCLNGAAFLRFKPARRS